jgi:exocyst complex component 4
MVTAMCSNSLNRFVFDGVGFLIDDLLIRNARHIRLANSSGMKKISRNMLALQQCVKTIVHDARDGELLRAKQYFSLFSLNPQVCTCLRVVVALPPNLNCARTCSL